MIEISYSRPTWLPDFKTDLAKWTQNLPPYKDDALQVSYKRAKVAFAVNICMIKDMPDEGTVDRSTKIALVRRASGDGTIGSWSGVSGYLGRVKHSEAKAHHSPENRDYDPVKHTVIDELQTECNLSDEQLSAIRFMGGLLVEFPRTKDPKARIYIVPVLGLCNEEPRIEPNQTEISDYRWVPLPDVKHVENIEPGFVEHTLPGALGTLSLPPEEIQALLHA